MSNTTQKENEIKAYLNPISDQIDINACIKQWQALENTYDLSLREMPSPIWAKRGFEDDGKTAWERIRKINSQVDLNNPISIYIHVPFCESRCGFCDCYSIPFGKGKKQLEKEYATTLLHEIEIWSTVPHISNRPVTTIHFGGGTPNSLENDLFEEIINACKKYFSVSDNTEWALESTCRLLSVDHLTFLKNLGFTRLHLGVQTLEDSIRLKLGRQNASEEVLDKIGLSIQKGFITSVDILNGLPGQTIEGVTKTLNLLHESGVHGISVYQLNISNNNLRFFQNFNNYQKNIWREYVFFQAMDQFLIKNGYKKNHFSHYALKEDRNLYFTHALRQEDLLAIGTTGDGVFQHYHYMHHEYKNYLDGSEDISNSLVGGIFETEDEIKIHPIEVRLMCGIVDSIAMAKLNLDSLLEKWKMANLILPTKEKNVFTLTANGSWIIHQMIDELHNFQIVD